MIAYKHSRHILNLRKPIMTDLNAFSRALVAFIANQPQLVPLNSTCYLGVLLLANEITLVVS